MTDSQPAARTAYMAHPSQVFWEWMHSPDCPGKLPYWDAGRVAAALDAVALARALEHIGGNSLLSLNRSEVITTLLSFARSQGEQAGVADVELFYEELAEWRTTRVEQIGDEQLDISSLAQPRAAPATPRPGRLSAP